MGVDYLVCKNCEDTFPDCGEFVTCEGCGEHWCSDECAEEDGYIENHCKLGIDVGDSEEKEADPRCPNESWCNDCDYFVEDSCGYCRNEIVDDSDLLDFALSKLNMSKEHLTISYVESLK